MNKEDKDKWVFISICTIILFILMLTIAIGKYDYVKETEFSSEHEPGTDSYMEDSLSYAHPSWTYEQICDTLYGPEEDAY